MTLGRMRGEYQRPEGLFFTENFLSEHEEQKILRFIETITFDEVKMHDQVAKRQVKDYGFDYDFTSRTIEPIEPLPDQFLEMREKAALWADLKPEELVECLVTKYPKGATIGWHRDAYAFGSKILGISLASSCIMRFQKVDSSPRLVYELNLTPRSLYMISGPARYKWQHSIPPTKDLRYSITFRTLRK